MARQYPALIHKDKHSDFGVSFPDFPGCVTAGSTPDEAYEMAQEALQLHVDGMLEDKERLPDPSALADVLDKVTNLGAMVALMVPVRVPGKARRVDITLEENLLNDIDQAAREVGITRSAFLATGARQMIQADRPPARAGSRQKKRRAAG